MKKEKTSKNIVSGIVFLCVSVLLFFLMPEQVQTTETSAFTAKTFPTIALCLIMLCGALLIVQGAFALWGEKKSKSAEKEAGQSAGKKGNSILLIEILILVVVAVVLGNFTGLLVSGILIGAGFLALYHDKQLLHYAIVIAIVVIYYFLLKQVFGLQIQ